jgi:hypothetical protein
MNLIKYRITGRNLPTGKVESSIKDQEVKPNMPLLDKRVQSTAKKALFSLLICSILASAIFVAFARNNKAEAATFGLGNDYNQILELNGKLTNNVPVSIEKISISHTEGDKRVIALLMFLQKYNSPMASLSVSKAFVESADRNGFGDKWTLLPAIAGIESGFGKITPNKGKKQSFNAWGWGGPGHWVYFNSWEDSAERISKGIAVGYGSTNLNPEKMMASYCPPCATSGGMWAKGVKQYMAEINSIYKSI